MATWKASIAVALLISAACRDSAEPSAAESSEDDGSTVQCHGNLDCDVGEVCDEGSCRELDCMAAGSCESECGGVVDCGLGEVCDNGECILAFGVCSTTPRFDSRPLSEAISGDALAVLPSQVDADAAIEMIVGTTQGLWLVDDELAPLLLLEEGAAEIDAADLDADGDHDLVVRLAEGGLLVFSLSAGTFTAGVPIDVDAVQMASGDLDGDGADDVVVLRPTDDDFEALAAFADGVDAALREPVPLVGTLDLPIVELRESSMGGLADLVAHREGRTCIWSGTDGFDAAPGGQIDDAVSMSPLVGLHVNDDEVVTAQPTADSTVVSQLTGFGLMAIVPLVATTSIVGDLVVDEGTEVVVGGDGAVAVVGFGEPRCYSVLAVEHDGSVLAIGDHDGDALVDLVVSRDGVATLLMRRPG